MKILMVTPELVPYVKVGGLGDVAGALPKALAAEGHDIRIICPLHGVIQPEAHWKAYDTPFPVRLGQQTLYARLWETPLEPGSKVIVYFIEFDAFFGRREVYAGPWGDHSDNGQRFSFFARAAIDLPGFINWIPDIFHAHDWTAGLVPVYLNTTELNTILKNSASVFSIHNLQFQGIFPRELLSYAGLPSGVFRPDGLESMGYVNMMKGGIYHATKVSTVSPNYAREIQTPDFGFGLNHVLKFRAADLIGVLNGVDMDLWDPRTDSHLVKNYGSGDWEKRSENKIALQKEMGLEVNPDIPLFGLVSRLYEQKGVHLLLEITERLMRDMTIQLAILGSGDTHLENSLRKLADRFPGKLALYIGFNEGLSHRFFAGTDFFLVPSLFEPCGLTQMYAMRYGSVPVVRATGGLVDSVHNYIEGKGHGTGFVFHEASADALYYTMGWACSTFYDRREELRQLLSNAMAEDFRWAKSATTYSLIYQWALDSRRKAFPR